MFDLFEVFRVNRSDIVTKYYLTNLLLLFLLGTAPPDSHATANHGGAVFSNLNAATTAVADDIVSRLNDELERYERSGAYLFFDDLRKSPEDKTTSALMVQPGAALTEQPTITLRVDQNTPIDIPLEPILAAGAIRHIADTVEVTKLQHSPAVTGWLSHPNTPVRTIRHTDPPDMGNTPASVIDPDGDHSGSFALLMRN